MVYIALNTILNTVQVNQEFDVFVYIYSLADSQNILGFHNVIKYNPEFVSLVNYEIIPDSLLNPIIGQPIVDVNNATGMADFSAVRSNTNLPGKNGLVYKLKFKALKIGTT